MVPPTTLLSSSTSRLPTSLVFRPCSSLPARHAALPVRPDRQPQLQQQRTAVVVSAKGAKGGKGGKVAEADTKGGKDAGGDLAKVAADAKKDADDRMKKAMGVVLDGFGTIRTGRANPAILDKITVDYFGVRTPLKSMGSITVPESTTLVITPFDKSSIKDIERAIQESDIGINPNNDGERIRLIMPPMTQERRKDLVKQVGKMSEDGKVAVRNVRKDAMKKVDKVEFPKDDKKALEDDIQKLTDTYCKKLDDATKAKSDELMKM